MQWRQRGVYSVIEKLQTSELRMTAFRLVYSRVKISEALKNTKSLRRSAIPKQRHQLVNASCFSCPHQRRAMHIVWTSFRHRVLIDPAVSGGVVTALAASATESQGHSLYDMCANVQNESGLCKKSTSVLLCAPLRLHGKVVLAPHGRIAVSAWWKNLTPSPNPEPDSSPVRLRHSAV